MGVVKKVSICFPNGGLHTEEVDNATYKQEKKESGEGCIKTLGWITALMSLGKRWTLRWWLQNCNMSIC